MGEGKGEDGEGVKEKGAHKKCEAGAHKVASLTLPIMSVFTS